MEEIQNLMSGDPYRGKVLAGPMGIEHEPNPNDSAFNTPLLGIGLFLM